MDPARFDSILRTLAGYSRRRLLAKLAAVAIGPAGMLLPGAAARRRCRNGEVACEPGGCGGAKRCVTNLREGTGQPDKVCCCPRSVFDPEDKACCPDEYVCRRNPRHPEKDECCNPEWYTCVPRSGCCRNENVHDGKCRPDCCGASCCPDNRACCGGLCCDDPDQSCCDTPDGPVCGFCIRTIRIRG